MIQSKKPNFKLIKMKKITLILITILFTNISVAETKTVQDITPTSLMYKAIQVKAEFVGKSEKSFYFKKVDDSKMLEFTIISMRILSQYDFDDKANIGKVFNLTYEVQKLETLVKDSKNDGIMVSQFKERKILMNIALVEGSVAKN